MENKEIFILMHKNQEILSFVPDFDKQQTAVIEKLDRFDLAPSNLKEASDHLDGALSSFFASRCIPNTRHDYQDILKATGCRCGLELSFKGHGASLSNHYWVKRKGENLRYEDINFFTNRWDDSFAKAVITRDYEALSRCDLNVPDVTTCGWGSKGWIIEDGIPKLYKLGINKGHYEEALGEVLASSMAARLFDEGEYLKYELKKVGDQYASVSPLMIKEDEELIPLAEFISDETYNMYRDKNIKKELLGQFFERIKKSDIPGLYIFFVKLMCLRNLCFVNDLHFRNISLIKNTDTGALRVAPLYDLGGAFGSSQQGQKILQNPNKATLFLIYYIYSDFEPSWDYSWYDGSKLNGYEEEIKQVLSKSDFFTSDLIEAIITIYHHQKGVLDEMAHRNGE